MCNRLINNVNVVVVWYLPLSPASDFLFVKQPLDFKWIGIDKDNLMKFKFLNVSFVALILSATCIINTANAGIITEKWSATVSKVHNSNAYTLGDVLQFTFSYDNTSTESHRYDKGLDGLAGTADDILTFSWKILENPNYDVYSNITTNFLDLATPMIDETIAQGFAVNDWNHFYNTYSHTPNGMAWSEEEISVDSSNGKVQASAFYTSAFSNGYIGTSYTDGGMIINKYIELSSVNRVLVQQVPEPTTLAIFAIGMMGLASRRFNKKP